MAPLQPGCDVCDIRFFASKNSRKYHMANSVRHRVRLLIRLGESHHDSLSTECAEVDIGPVLVRFEHLPILGHHKCRECGVVVVLSPVIARDIAKTVNELHSHLSSWVHQSLHELGGENLSVCLPSKTLPISEHEFVCYACEPYSVHKSFVALCSHVQRSHSPIKQEEECRPLKRSRELDFLVDNSDGLSRTCTLCNVVVWYEDDWHLTGKRHKKAVANAQTVVDNNGLNLAKLS